MIKGALDAANYDSTTILIMMSILVMIVDGPWVKNQKVNWNQWKDVAISDELPPNEGKDESESLDMPLEEMNEIVQEYGSAMVIPV